MNSSNTFIEHRKDGKRSSGSWIAHDLKHQSARATGESFVGTLQTSTAARRASAARFR